MNGKALPASPANITAALSLLPALVVGFVVYGWVALHAYTIGGFSDAMDYLFMADFYRAAFTGEPTQADWQYYRSTRFPPLFPLLLSAFGAGTSQVHLAVAISNLTAIAAALCVAWWAFANFASSWAVALTALALLLYPAYFLLNLFPISEPLAIMVFATVFALLETPRQTPARLLVVGLIIGFAPLARTALLPLLPAFAIWLALKRRLLVRNMALPVALAFLPWVSWTIYRRALGADSYLSRLTFGGILDHVGGWPEVIWLSPSRVFVALIENWVEAPSLIAIPVSLLLAALATVGCLLRMRRNQIDGWFLFGYLAMILVWPFPDELGRFLVQIYPCLLVCAITSALEFDAIWRQRSKKNSWRYPVTALLVAAIVLATLPAAVKFVHRATLPVEREMLGDKREPNYFRAPTDELALQSAEVMTRARFLAMALPEHLPPGECVYATMPHLLRLYGGEMRTVYYPTDMESVEAARDALTACDYYFLIGLGVVQYGMTSNYPANYLKGWVEPVLISEIVLPDRTIAAAALVRRAHASPTVSSTADNARTD